MEETAMVNGSARGVMMDPEFVLKNLQSVGLDGISLFNDMSKLALNIIISTMHTLQSFVLYKTVDVITAMMKMR